MSACIFLSFAGTASVARGYSGYIDSLFNGTMQRHLQEVMPIDIPNVSEYPDFLAFGITLLLAGAHFHKFFMECFCGSFSIIQCTELSGKNNLITKLSVFYFYKQKIIITVSWQGKISKVFDVTSFCHFN